LPVPFSELRYGRLIWAVLKDRNGFRKRRPAVILTPSDEINETDPFVVAAVTTTFASPPPPNHVELPWNADPRRVSTRLARRSAAVVSWIQAVYADEVEEVSGDVPARTMQRIQAALRRHQDENA
jgi:mRNA-degrading endonuclease toxin of MazEF toxin-antitoxin module